MNVFKFTVGLMIVSQIVLAWISMNPAILSNYTMGAMTVAIYMVGIVIENDKHDDSKPS